jgi:uncharacterized membrane protein YozB (DUF420 family)
MVLLNPIAILLVMVPSFRRSLAPPIPAGIHNSYYMLAAAHAALGTVAELLGLYVLVVAATSILPKRLRFTRYRAWMRATLVLWWRQSGNDLIIYYAIYITLLQLIVGPLLKDSNPLC